jgi:hypothetical protein
MAKDASKTLLIIGLPLFAYGIEQYCRRPVPRWHRTQPLNAEAPGDTHCREKVSAFAYVVSCSGRDGAPVSTHILNCVVLSASVTAEPCA